MEIKSASTTNLYGEEMSHWILPKIPFKAISLVSLHKIPGWHKGYKSFFGKWSHNSTPEWTHIRSHIIFTITERLISLSSQNPALLSLLYFCTQVRLFLIPSDSRLSAICSRNQTPIGVKKKLLRVYTVHLKGLVSPSLERFWSKTPQHWCRQTERLCLV